MQTAVLEAPPLPQSIAASTKTQREPGLDPRVRRFGYNPGVWEMVVDQRKSGLQEPLIPGGVLIPFETVDMNSENYEGVLKKNARAPEILKEKTAAWLIRNVVNAYGGTGMKDKGFRELTPLMPLTDYEARQVFYSVHPTFGMVGHTCPYQMDVCPTCRLEMLADYIPQSKVEEALQGILVASNTRYAAYASQKYASLLSEMERRHGGENNGITTLKEPEHWMRRQLHQPKPADMQMDMAAKLAAAQAETNAKNMEMLGDKFAEALRAIAEKPLDPVQQKQLEVMEAMMNRMTDKPEEVKRGPGRPPKQTDE